MNSQSVAKFTKTKLAALQKKQSSQCSNTVHHNMLCYMQQQLLFDTCLACEWIIVYELRV